MLRVEPLWDRSCVGLAVGANDRSVRSCVSICTIVDLTVAENRTCLSNVKYVLPLDLQKFKYIVYMFVSIWDCKPVQLSQYFFLQHDYIYNYAFDLFGIVQTTEIMKLVKLVTFVWSYSLLACTWIHSVLWFYCFKEWI
jgi:hypothetical protein